MSDPILEIKGLNKSFGPVHVLHDVDFTVRAGEVTALVGDNGAGKSTLVKCVAGIYGHDSGTVVFQGQEVHIRGPKDAAALGIEVVYQDLALADNLDIVQNMFLGRERGSQWLLDESSMEKAARETLASLSVRTVKSVRTSVASLSGGQRQRVAMGRAIVRNPKAFLMDEPLSNLDAKLRVQMRTSLSKLQKQLGTTTVYVTHDQTEAMTLGDRVVVLRGGRVQQIGSPQFLYENPANLFVAGFIGSPSMNFLPATLENGQVNSPLGHFDLAGRVKTLVEAADAPREVILGIRPEHFE
ncbi:ABC transporter ATP-binding protein, partial [Kibdelosporangium lantanae]